MSGEGMTGGMKPATGGGDFGGPVGHTFASGFGEGFSDAVAGRRHRVGLSQGRARAMHFRPASTVLRAQGPAYLAARPSPLPDRPHRFAGDHLTADFNAQSYGGGSKAAIASGHPLAICAAIQAHNPPAIANGFALVHAPTGTQRARDENASGSPFRPDFQRCSPTPIFANSAKACRCCLTFA
jgi:hypothetical protein